jgi:hypothetical protein
LVLVLGLVFVALQPVPAAEAAPFRYHRAKLVLSVKGHGWLVDVDSSGSKLLYAGGRNQDAVHQLYVYDRKTRRRELVSSTADGRTAAGGWVNTAFFLGSDRLVFTAQGPGLAPGVTDAQYEVYVKNLTSGDLQLISAASDGTPATGQDTQVASVDASSQKVLFSSEATNLSPGITAHTMHLYVKNLASGSLDRVDYDSNGRAISGEVLQACTGGLLTHGGDAVAMNCWGAGITPNNTGSGENCFLRTLSTGAVLLLSADSGGHQIPGGFSVCESIAPNNSQVLMQIEPASVYRSIVKDVATGRLRAVRPLAALVAPNWSRRTSWRRDRKGQDQFVAQPLFGKHTQALTVNRKGAWANRGCAGGGKFTWNGRKFFWSTSSTNMPGHRRHHFAVYMNASKA